ncbi:MAG TPA: thiamine-phosphate kinase [Xanthomonadaceae bacterium]|nr:thiamine-phosphate kinase [Xanthomonadaceae bacterium]
MAEFDLIARIQARATRRDDVVLGIGDDAALLRVPRDRLLVVATDTLNADVHFPEDTLPDALGWKALAVNLSDLAAMGATPAWCTLSLSLPEGDALWVERFLDGFLALANEHAVALVGGDTTRGPLSVCVTVHGLIEEGRVLARGGARIGDDLWISGTLGDAAAALSQWRAGGAAEPALRRRLDRPVPRLELGRALAGIASACIDVSDGLLADVGHLCAASGVGAEVQLAALPASPMLAMLFTDETRHVLQAGGGDDYELCFAAAPAKRDAVLRAAREAGTPVTRIGCIEAGTGVRALLADGGAWRPPQHGYEHFR